MLEHGSDRETPFSGRKLRKGWFQAFFRRQKGLSIRKPERIKRLRVLVTEPSIRESFATLRRNSVDLNALDLKFIQKTFAYLRLIFVSSITLKKLQYLTIFFCNVHFEPFLSFLAKFQYHAI